MPEVGEEGSNVTVTLKLSRELTGDEKWCYMGSVSGGNDGDVCIEGGINVWDTYNDHMADEHYESDGTTHTYVDHKIKFVFRGSQTEDRLTVPVLNDQCITPERKLRIKINTAFDDVDDYGYIINEKEFTVPVNGNDTTNDGANCDPGNDGKTEEAHYNKAPTFDDTSTTLEVYENTEAGQDVGSPVTATDPESDTLTYSLQGTGRVVVQH